MIYEQRVYTVELNKRETIIEEVKRFLSVMEKHGVKGLGPFRPVIGNSNELMYFMIYDSMTHREQAWDARLSDADYTQWRKDMAERVGKEGLGISNEATTLLSLVE